SAFSRWVSEGIVPKPLPGTRRWDRKALDIALDKLSGIPVSSPSKENDGDRQLAEWIAQDEVRKAARLLDPAYVRKKAEEDARRAKRIAKRSPLLD
ncbi:MAG: hypothetical protein JWR21_2839, partial [Herminiimonas sp.]|nr:hypothetical protein [Herminiimonas sp.]